MPISNKVPLLDKGWVQLVDMMGDDSAIVDAARVSVEGLSPTMKDRHLIRYLLRMKHTSPFEQVELKFRVRCPLFVARQWLRHRTANVNEISGRYTELPRDAYLPDEDRLTKQSKNNHQGSSEELVDNPMVVRSLMEAEQGMSFSTYDRYLNSDLARELSRINLPLSTYTEFMWKIDLHNFFHFVNLRMDSHAQYEIQVYAAAMLNLIRNLGLDFAIEAAEDYTFYASNMSRMELQVLKAMAEMLPNTETVIRTLASQANLSKREVEELLEKVS